MSENVEKLLAGFKGFNRKAKANPKMTEEELRTIFKDSKVLKTLGYETVGRDIRIEKGVKGGKRSDIHCLDDYKNVIFVIEFKRPEVTNLNEHFDQLWDRYVRPLRANYGVLTNGDTLLLYERVNGNSVKVIDSAISEISRSDWGRLFDALSKKELEKTSISQVIGYFEKFDSSDNRINLSTEEAQSHFFDSFELKEGSVFVDFLEKTYRLFDFEITDSKFLSSAYSFWRTSYAKEPEKIPDNWKKIMKGADIETSKDNLFKFMFCLETSYSLFTRIILAKACEDYKLPGIDFSDFIKREVKGSAFRGKDEVPLLSWPVLTFRLIKEMRQKLVKSVFEGDIFYWWADSFEEFDKGEKSIWATRQDREKLQFGSAIAEVILTLYKFDFSEIVGDPLGTLYQRYFDKETRKALGEFYTPKEVVDYILDAVGYRGKTVVGKRLLDPACGSGTFLVEALKRYLEGAKEKAEERGWDQVLKDLCNEYHIVGFDIHPFATFMAQMQFMLVLIPKYKEAILQDRSFVLNRLPVFRTDSLAMEAKEERIIQMTLQNGTKPLLVDTMLPIKEDENGGNLKIEMPYKNDVLSKTDLTNVPEYFAALQAVFDTVKDSAWRNVYDIDEERLKTSFRKYFSDKDWDKLVFFFKPYAVHLLESFEKLKDAFGDGRLIKSIEDVTLAALLKGYVDYDFVVGNPPYIRIQTLPEETRKKYSEIYETLRGNYDIYIPFIERGTKWLSFDGKLGFINSNQFIFTKYGERLREYLLNFKIEQVIDFTDTGVFKDVTNYPCILTVTNTPVIKSNLIKCVKVVKPKLDILNDIKLNFNKTEYYDDYYRLFEINQSTTDKNWVFMPQKEQLIFKRIEEISNKSFGDVSKRIFQGLVSGKDNVYIVNIISEIGRDLVKIRPINSSNEFDVEKEILKPLLKGKDVRKWKIDWKELWIIYPYKIIENDAILYTKNEMKEKFPNCWEYLQEHENELKGRERGKWKDKADWYAFGRKQNLHRFERIKLLVQVLANESTLAFDEEGKFYFMGAGGSNAYGILFKKEYDTKDWYLYFLGLLNSKTLDFYLKHISSLYSGKYYIYDKQYLERLPIKLPQNKKQEKLASQITEKVNIILEKVKLEQKTEKFPQEYIKEYREKGEEFDSINITFNSDHKDIKIIVEKSLEEDFNLTIGKKERLITVDSEAKVKYVKEALEGKRAKKNEKLQFLIPKDDLTVNEILTKLEEDKRNTQTPTVSELEEEINELVYKLYGLNEKDRKVIEEFLERF